ncbi:MAG: glycosyltransferase family 4 protein [Opitutae bacterium]|nr:glycosyltransferase family 4 protein [Opitutae bacterium]
MPRPATNRLIIATHEFHPHRGGIAVYTAEMAAAATRLGYDVEVWAPALPDSVVEPAWPFAVRRLPITGSHSWRNQWRMARQILTQRDAWQDGTLYVPEPGPLLSMLLLQFFDTLPPGRLVLTLHGSEILRLAMRPLTRWSARRLFARANRISVVSRHAQELLLQYFPRTADKVVLTPGALRTGFTFVPSPAAKPPGGRIIILTVARIHPRKGQLCVIEALRALPPEQRAQIEYWLVGGHGKERYEPALRAAANNAGFPIKFLGDVPDEQLGQFYAQADIFAMTSMPHKLSVEGFGLVYLEAGAHGLPVVAHDIGGVAEAVTQGETGLLVSPDDPAALTAAFARLIADPELRRRFGSAGRQRALAHTWQDNALTLFGQPPAAAST